MDVSVIIPTYNRLETLFHALGSLQEQSLLTFEVLVVDNAASLDVLGKIEEFNKSARIVVRYISESRLGAHHARHAGARAASGDILIFTDDDATFEPGWLNAYAKAFADNPSMVAAGGPVLPSWNETPPRWLLEYIGNNQIFPMLSRMKAGQKFHLTRNGVFLSVNMGIRRNIFFEMGGFNPDLCGDVLLGDGEVGLYRKL